MKEPISDALFRFVAGRSPRYDREYSRGWVDRLIRAAGSQNKLAAALGVARASVQSWAKGATPSLESQELMRVALRRVDLPAGRERRLRASNALRITGTMAGDGGSGERVRTIHLNDRYLRAGTVDRLVAAYLAGATPIQLQTVVWQGITDPSGFYQTLFFPGGPNRARSHRIPGAAVPPAAAGGAGGGAGGAVGGGALGAGLAGGAAPAEGEDEDEFWSDDELYEGDVVALDDDYILGVTGVSG